MGVEPTEDSAERPSSRFEDGETHRSSDTSMMHLLCHSALLLSTQPLDAFHADLGQIAHDQRRKL